MSNKPATEANCAKCGACTSVCPVYQITGKESATARGKLHLLNNPPEKSSTVYSEIFSQCLLCGACEEVCSRGIKIKDIIAAARTRITAPGNYSGLKKLAARKTLTSPFLLKKLAVLPPDLPSLPQPSEPAERTKEGYEKINYFSGCLADYLAPDIKKATRNLVRKAAGKGFRSNEGRTCCGLAAYTAGDSKQAREMARLNIEAFEDNSSPVLTSCASCYSHLKKYPDLFSGDPVWAEKARLFSDRLREFSSFLIREIPENFRPGQGEKSRIAIHDPCHLRFGKEKNTEAPRRLIRKTGDFLLQDIPGQCCGHGGLFQINHAGLSRKIADKKIKDLSEVAPDYLLTTCSGCLLQLNKTVSGSDLPVRVYHPAVFINHFLK